MGQAKQRGPFEQRLSEAEKRNAEIVKMVEKAPHLVKFHREHGAQRLATRMIMSGVLRRTSAI